MEDLLSVKFPRCLLWVPFTNSTLHLGWFCCFSTQVWEVFHSPPSFTKSLIRFFCVYLLLLLLFFFRIWTFLDWVCPSKNIIPTSFIRLNLIYWSGREETALIFSWLRLVFHYRGSTNINASIHITTWTETSLEMNVGTWRLLCLCHSARRWTNLRIMPPPHAAKKAAFGNMNARFMLTYVRRSRISKPVEIEYLTALTP